MKDDTIFNETNMQFQDDASIGSSGELLNNSFYNTTNVTQQENGLFENYVVKTVDPGKSLLVFIALYCLLSIILVPIIVKIYDKFVERTKKINYQTGSSSIENTNSPPSRPRLKKNWKSESNETDKMTFLEANGNSDNVTSDVFLPQIISPDTKFNGNTNGLAVVIDETNDLPITKTKSFDSTTATTVSDHASVKKIDDFDEYPHDAVRIENHPNSRPNEKKEGIEGYDMEPLEIDKSQKQNYDNDSYSYLQSTSSDETSYKINDHLKRTDALDSEREMFSRQSSCETVSNKMKDLAQYDNESKQILKLALLPM